MLLDSPSLGTEAGDSLDVESLERLAQLLCVRDEVAGAEKATYFVEAAFVSTPVSVVGDFRAPPPDSGAIGIL